MLGGVAGSTRPSPSVWVYWGVGTLPLVRADLIALSSWESSFKLSLERRIDPIWGARQSGLDSAAVLLCGAPSLEMEAESGSPLSSGPRGVL